VIPQSTASRHPLRHHTFNLSNGWTRLERGPNIEYQKDGARYFLRGKAKTVEGWTADYYGPGSKKADIKIRLGEE
jgi:hypothetical protein